MRHMGTTTEIETIIGRYLATWSVAAGAFRSEQIRPIWAEDGRLVDPLIEAVGPDAIAADGRIQTAIGLVGDAAEGAA
jgi:hypothetical protein